MDSYNGKALKILLIIEINPIHARYKMVLLATSSKVFNVCNTV